MKKIFLFLSIGALLIGCSQQEELLNLSTENQQYNKYELRSLDCAISIAQSVKYPEMSSRSSGVNSKPKIKGTHTVVSDISRSTASDTLFYAIDFEEGGFALIAAPTNIEPVIALIDNGAFNDIENESVLPYQGMIQNAKNVISERSILLPDPGYPFIPKDLTPVFKYDTVEYHEFQTPAVKVAWNQEWPANIYTPNGIAGCGPLAIAQLFSALEIPQNITYTFPEKDINTERLDWKAIKKHIKSENGFIDECEECTASMENHKTIGRLCREIGYRLKASYGTNSTGTDDFYYTTEIYNLTHRRCDITIYELDALYQQLNTNKGVGLSVSYATNVYGGHAWIIDAVGRVGCDINEYTYDAVLKEYQFSRKVQQATKILHHNWGWGGVCNGWINIEYLDPNKCLSHDYVGENNERPYIFNPDDFICYFYNL